MPQPSVAVTGLATMGQNLARNLARHGVPVVVHNRTRARTEAVVERFGHEGPITPAWSLAELAAAMAPPRAVVLMVQAGAPVDAVLAELVPHLEAGDVVVDGGNSDPVDSARRADELAAAGLRYLGMGVSGGEEGALLGPSLMPGGDEDAYRLLEPVLTAIAADVGGSPCTTYVGPGATGHLVKAVHNGIEYADMQLIAEACELLRVGAGLGPQELADVVAGWDEGDLDSFLVEITATVLRRTDDDGTPLLDHVLDVVEQKGTGRWVVRIALEVGAAVPTIAEAVMARSLSELLDERRAAAGDLPGPADVRPVADPSFVDDVRDALHAAKVVAYAQGFDLLRRAGRAAGAELRLDELARIWRGGCIIRARFLDRVREAYLDDPDLPNLVRAPAFEEVLQRAQEPWRRVVAEAARLGVPAPATASALAWYDGYRSARLPTALLAAQRDLFGAHGFRRVDDPAGAERHHVDWAQPAAASSAASTAAQSTAPSPRGAT